jgi:hypothetical protein
MESSSWPEHIHIASFVRDRLWVSADAACSPICKEWAIKQNKQLLTRRHLNYLCLECRTERWMRNKYALHVTCLRKLWYHERRFLTYVGQCFLHWEQVVPIISIRSIGCSNLPGFGKQECRKSEWRA